MPVSKSNHFNGKTVLEKGRYVPQEKVPVKKEESQEFYDSLYLSSEDYRKRYLLKGK